jgi:hypothetical protein
VHDRGWMKRWLKAAMVHNVDEAGPIDLQTRDLGAIRHPLEGEDRIVVGHHIRLDYERLTSWMTSKGSKAREKDRDRDQEGSSESVRLRDYRRRRHYHLLRVED